MLLKLLLATCLTLIQAAKIPQPDLSALLAIKRKVSDPFKYLSNWQQNVNCENWGGVQCDRKSGRVVYLNMGYGGHSGRVPSELNKLTALRELFLEGNFLSGPLPDLRNLKALQIISLTGNQLTGTLNTISGLSRLQKIFAATNSFSGRIPAGITKMKSLARLELSFNQLSGSIPSGIGSLTKLQSLYLEYNRFSGPIPASLGQLANLKYFNLSNNLLSGKIPVSLSKLNQVLEFSLSSNRLVGGVPVELAALRQIRNMDLSNNLLTGSALAIINSPRFNTLNLRNNLLSGLPQIPLNNIWACVKLNFSGNCLDYTSMKDFCYNRQRATPVCQNRCNSFRAVPKICDKCFSVNPCGVGHSINQLYSQNYTCVCPVGYKVGNLAVTKNATCVPGYSYPQTWTVATYVDMVCRDLYEPLDMDKKTFIQKNPSNVCGMYPVPYGTVFNISANLQPCSLFYRLNKGDTCASVAKKFGISALNRAGSPNPDLDCCNLRPGTKVCIKRGQPAEEYLCQNYYTLGSRESCPNVINKYFGGSYTKFFTINPGVYCDLLKPGADSFHRIDRRVCLKAIKKKDRDAKCKNGATDKVKAGEYCDRIYKKHFKNNVNNFKKANQNVVCDNSKIYIGLSYCTNY